MRILVADDDPVSRTLLVRALRRINHEVVEAANGHDAFAALEAPDAPPLALIDWNMPDRSGVEICAQVTRHPYIILVTARTSSADAIAALDAGANDFISKPFALDVLMARVNVGVRTIELRQKLQRTEALLDAVLDHIPDGVVLSDENGRVVFANSRAERGQSVLGKTRAELLTDNAKLAVDPARYLEATQANATEPVRSTGEFELRIPERVVVRVTSKPVVLDRDRGAVGQLDVFSNVTELVEEAERREQRAQLDALTGLATRQRAEQIIAEAMAAARRDQTPLSFALIDADHFKNVNDTFGHAAGDEVLRRIARVMKSAVRSSDSVTRWGGEEFLVVMPGTTLANAQIVAERIRSRVTAGPHDGAPRVSVSVGLAELSPIEATEQTIARADEQLYRAKHAGRNRVCA